nr:hypothetical protein [Tanacetum cinerariifolium]
MDIFAFIHTPDPTNVRVVERERNEAELRLLDTTVGRTVPLLPVALDRANSELEASAANTVVEDAAPMQARRQRKIKSMVVDASGVSYPPKKMSEDHGTLSGSFVGGKSRSALQRLLAGAMLNAEVEVMTIPSLPFVIASVLYFFRLLHHSGTKVAEAEVDSLIRSSVPIMTTVSTTTSTADPTLATKKKFVEPSPFGAGSSSASRTDPITCVFLDLIGSDFLVGVIRTVINPDTDL